jgi:hypothetical protein
MTINEDQLTDNHTLHKEWDVIEHHNNEKSGYDAKKHTYIVSAKA